MSEKEGLQWARSALTKSLILMILLMLAFPTAAGVEENNTISIVIEQFPPMTFVDDKGIYSGFSVELIDHIAMTEGWQVEYTLLPWADCLESVKNGDADLLIAVAYSKERDTYLDYTNNSISLEWSQVFASEDSHINSIRDLDGKKVAVVENTYGAIGLIDLTQQYGVECEFVYVDDFGSVMSQIREGKVDAGMFARSYASHNDLGMVFKETAIETFPISLHCATTEGENQELIATIDTYLADLKADNASIYYDIEDKWLSYGEPFELPSWVVGFLIVLILAVLTFIVISVVLRKEVLKRTSELLAKNEELNSSKKKYLTLVEGSKEGIIIVQDEVLVFANNRIAEMIGYDLGSLLNTSIFDHVADDSTHIVAKICKNMDNGSQNIPSSYEIGLKRKDGSSFVAELSPSLIEHNSKRAIMAIIRDIEERKQAEMMKEEMIRAEESNRLKSEFLANMSHELRTPLNAVIGFSELLEMQTSGGLNEKQQRYVNNIHSSGKHLLDLINGILDLSKVEAGRMELFIEPFLPVPIIHEVTNTLMPLAIKQDITLIYDLDDSPEIINADKLKFKQILFNLVSNAIKFTPKGGTINIGALYDEGDILVSVKDTGKGIPESEMKKIFYPFMQANNFDPKKIEGTGLGLSIVRSFVELHGGTVWIESELDVGTTFFFRIPVKTQVPDEL